MTLFRLLGPLEVEHDDGPIALGGERARALLTALLLQPNSLVPAYRLIEVLWPNATPDNPENALHQVVARLRSRLGPLGRCLVTRPPGYLIEAEPSLIDTERFEAAYREARSRSIQNPAGAAELLDEALALWRGPAYAEFADGFARSAATRLEELRLAAYQDRAALALRCGAVFEAVTRARQLTEAEPLRERPVELLMQALHADGRTSDALEAYRAYRDRLADELGLDPSAELAQLESRILRNEVERPRPASRSSSPQAGRPRQLPWRPGSMLGRERELQLLRDCLAERRLVTVVGPGGVGKTRLALEVAHQLAAQGTSTWWADLTTVTPERVVASLATALGAEIPVDPEPAGSLIVALAAYRGLMVLDNAETVLAELAPVVEQLADAAPQLTILATSRERLAVGPEHVHILSPLTLPEVADRENPAVRLFLERAPALEPDRLSADEVDVVADICRRLDGLPLAIELGAAQTRSFGVRELADRLDQVLDLTGGRRTADARHRTLRTVVDWSYGLLTEDEAQLFAQLSVFPGRFSLDQVEAVCAAAGGPDLASQLVRLVEQCMVQSASGRFWLLDTLRAYASERLDQAMRQRLRERHAHDTAARVSALRPGLRGPEEAVAVAAVNELEADLQVAWAYAVEHDRALGIQLAADIFDYAYLRQRGDLMAWGLTVAAWDIEHPGLPRALALAATAAWAAGRLVEAAELAERGVKAAGGLEARDAALAILQLGNLAMFAGRSEEAIAYFRRGARLERAGGNQTIALMDEISVCQAQSYYAGHVAEAAASIGQLLERARANGNPSCLTWAHYIDGEIKHALGDLPGAQEAYRAAIADGAEAESRLLVTLARSSSVTVSAQHGAPAEALEQFRRVVDEWENIGNEAAQWWTLGYLVVLLVRVGSAHDAALLAGAILGARERHPRFGRYETDVGQALADLRRRLGPTAEAMLAKGAALSYADTVDCARAAIRAAQTRA